MGSATDATRPSGYSLGFVTVTVTTPIADGCNAAKSYVSEFEFEEVVAEEEEEAP